jgi:hypothetical protein
MIIEWVLLGIWIVFPILSLYIVRRSFKILDDQLHRLDTEGARRLMRVLRSRTIAMVTINLLFLSVAIPSILFDGVVVSTIVLIALAILPIIYFLNVMYEASEVNRLVSK